MKNKEKAKDIATQRAMLLAPLFSDGLDNGAIKEIKERICRETGLSDRTLRRYLKSYRTSGFEGLMPKSRTSMIPGAISEEVLNEAIKLRREVPSRSVAEIIRILEWEEFILPGSAKRSTLQEKLQEKGYSGKHMAIYASGGIATRRFQKRTRNKLWHSDYPDILFIPMSL